MKYSVLFAAAICIFLISCKVPATYYKSQTVYYDPGKSGIVTVDSSMLVVIEPYKTKVDLNVERVIGYAAMPLEKGLPESKLGNFVADLCLYITNKNFRAADNTPVDFCVLNTGGLRSSLPGGAIKIKNIFELMPFENELVVLTLSGDSVASLLKYISDKGGVPVSNLKMHIGENNVSGALIGGNLFNKNKTYKIVTSDYLAEGGDAMIMFKGALKTENVKIKIRDAIIDYIEELNASGKFASAEIDGRITK